MTFIPPSLEKVIEEFSKFPGIGKKTAQRLGIHVLKSNSENIMNLAQALIDVKEKIKTCELCHNISETSPCLLCLDPKRDKTILCIVEDSSDIMLIEKTGYNGLYHVMGGTISPLEGISAEHIFIDDILDKVDQFNEIIISTNASIDGDTTSLYIQRLLNDKEIKITRLARGLPVGGQLEYVDEATLSKAIENRTNFND
tara:strand:+ start:2872 stop:3468 length:597 start_codon:yes stop_codon:yes gene_type:complete